MPDTRNSPLASCNIKASKYQQNLIDSIMIDSQKRNLFIDNIYKAIEYQFSTFTTNKDQIWYVLQEKQSKRVKKVISSHIFCDDGIFFLVHPKTGKASCFLDAAGKVIVCTIDNFKWDIGTKMSEPVYSAGKKLIVQSSIYHGRNTHNLRADKFHRNPFIIKQNMVAGQMLKQSGGIVFKTCKFLSSLPVTVLTMYFTNNQSVGVKLKSDDELEEFTIDLLIKLCDRKLVDYKKK